MRATTRQFVIDQLREGYACANVFYKHAYPTARNRIGELRAEGWIIETVRYCTWHYHAGNVVAYRLVAEPGVQMRLGGTT